jgi:HlyD family secretion protein
MKKINWKLAAVIVGVLALVGGGAWWYTQKQSASDVQYRTSKIERGNIQASVSASGAVNPVTQVSVGTQVSGQIKELYVDFNSEVKAGQLIAQIDPETFEYRVRSAQADLDASRAQVLTAQANVASSIAQVSRAKMEVAEAQRDYERQKTLVEKAFVTQSVADKARALVGTLSESVKVAEAQMAVTNAQVKSAQAAVTQRESTLAQARIDLARTKITSPVNGIVIKRSIEKGQTVAASLQSPELFVIAQNLQDMQVDASIDESDVGKIKTGQKATFTVDAFAGQTFEGEVRQVRKAAQTVANVVTYVAVIGFSNSGGRLLPGMTANVRVITDARENVLKVPNAALRMKIAGVEPAATGAPAATGGTPPTGTPPAGQSGNAGSWSWISEAVAQQGPGGAGGGFAAQRERLVTELQLTAEQQTKLDAIQTELRPQFMAMRDMADDERATAREKVTAQMRQKIMAMLTTEQKPKYQQIIAAQNARSTAGAGTGPTSGNAPSTANATKSIAPQANNTPATGQKGTTNSPKSATASVPASASTSATIATTPATAPAAAATPAAPVAPTLGADAGGSNPATQFRNRMVSELALTPAQIEKVDAIYASARPKMMALRDVPQEERGKAREKITAEIRAQLRDQMTAEQKPKFDALVAAAASRQVTSGKIYIMGADGKPVAYNVRLGITDGSSTELLISPNSPNASVLVEGAAVIIGVVNTGNSAASPSPARAPTGPRMGF